MCLPSTVMPNTNFEHVVMVFLRDRLVAHHLHRVGLRHLVDNPNLTDGLENHLRAAMLVGCKRAALAWLSIQIVAVNDGRVPEAGWLQSTKDWTNQPLDVAAFKTTAINCFRQPIFQSAQRFEAGGLAEGHTKTMLAGVDDEGIDRARQEPGDTIWSLDGGVLKCVEGNARMHALALGLVRGTVNAEEAGAWSMWVGR
jgi:hypothetical protein